MSRKAKKGKRMTNKEHNKVRKALGMPPVKTGWDLRREAKAIPLESRRAFWQALTVDRLTLGESMKLAGIQSMAVACTLVRLYTKVVKYEVFIPVEEIV